MCFSAFLINPAFANTWDLCLFLKPSMTLMYLIPTICWRGLKRFHRINRHSWPAVCDLIACRVCHILLYSSALPKPYLCKLIICPQMPNHMLMNNLQKWSVSCFPEKTKGAGGSVQCWRHRAGTPVKTSTELLFMDAVCACFGGTSLQHLRIVLAWELQSPSAVRWPWTVSYSLTGLSTDH